MADGEGDFSGPRRQSTPTDVSLGDFESARRMTALPKGRVFVVRGRAAREDVGRMAREARGARGEERQPELPLERAPFGDRAELRRAPAAQPALCHAGSEVWEWGVSETEEEVVAEDATCSEGSVRSPCDWPAEEGLTSEWKREASLFLCNDVSDAGSACVSGDKTLRVDNAVVRIDSVVRGSSLASIDGDDERDHDDDDDDDDDDDALSFDIEGAEQVSEEEAVEVQSFGESHARVMLKDGTSDIIFPHPRKQASSSALSTPRRSYVVSVPKAVDQDSTISSDLQHNLDHGDVPDPLDSCADRAQSLPRTPSPTQAVDAASRRRFQVRPTRVRHDSPVVLERRSNDGGLVEVNINQVRGPEGGEVKKNQRKGVVVARPNEMESKGVESKKTPSRNISFESSPGKKSRAGPGAALTSMASRGLNVIRGNHTNKSKAMVPNVSLQRDDWIEFATNAAHRHSKRRPWLARLVSPKLPLSPSAACKRVPAPTPPNFSGVTAAAVLGGVHPPADPTKKPVALPQRKFWQKGS